MESKFESICNELVTLQKAKNADYGDSFSNSVKEFGLTAALIPITNKVNRLKQLLQSDSAQVKDESIDDTLKDLACYAIMTLAEREGDLSNYVKNIKEKDAGFIADYLRILRDEIKENSTKGLNPISKKTESALNEARINRKLEVDNINDRTVISSDGCQPLKVADSERKNIGYLYFYIIPIIHKTEIL